MGVAASQNKSYKLGAARVNIKDEEVSLLKRYTRPRTRPKEVLACCTYTAYEAGATGNAGLAGNKRDPSEYFYNHKQIEYVGYLR